jgi:hypothetical protein
MKFGKTLCCCACWQGLDEERCQDGHVAYEGQLRSRASRAVIIGKVWGMSTMFWVASTASEMWAGLLHWLRPHAQVSTATG